MTDTVTFLGAEFRVAEKIGALPFMRFAKAAKAGADTSDMEGMIAMYDLLEQCIAADEWVRFQAHADKERADGDQLLAVVTEAFAVFAARPTGPRSASQGGPRTIEPSSTGDSSSPAMERVIDRYNREGRPDLALVVRKRQEFLSA